MASPWKLFSRLVSPRRQQRQENGSADDVKPVAYDQFEAMSETPNYSEEPESGIHGTVGANLVEMTDPAFSDDVDTAAHDATKASQAGKAAKRHRGRAGKRAERVESISPPSPAVPTASDDAISLDEEIRLLRNQLARMLQLQNAQLKKMLERFEC